MEPSIYASYLPAPSQRTQKALPHSAHQHVQQFAADQGLQASVHCRGLCDVLIFHHSVFVKK